MAKDKNKEPSQAENDYYKLKTDAVNRLANADKNTVRRVSDEEIEKYKSSKLGRLPLWLKALLMKCWFAGAICFFFYWGLAQYLGSWLDQMFVFGLGLGVCTDLLTNNVLRFLSGDDKEYYPYMMITSNKYWSFIGNIIYAFILLFITIQIYRFLGINVEPLFFGIFYTAVDMLFITIKNKIINKRESI